MKRSMQGKNTTLIPLCSPPLYSLLIANFEQTASCILENWILCQQKSYSRSIDNRWEVLKVTPRQSNGESHIFKYFYSTTVVQKPFQNKKKKKKT